MANTKIDEIHGRFVDWLNEQPNAFKDRLTNRYNWMFTNGQDMIIGSLYGFNLIVKTESSAKELFDLTQNKFFVEGEGRIKYSYNNGSMATYPKLASLNFLNALEKIPKLAEKYESEMAKVAKDLPVLQEIVGSVWKKEEELKTAH